MLNNLPKTLVSSKNRPDSKGTIFAVRLGFIMLALVGLSLVAKSADRLKPTVGQTSAQNLAILYNSTSTDPILLTIPGLKISAGFEPLGLNSNKTIQVPKDPKKVGWFTYGSKPGDVGPAVIVGHLDSQTGAPAVFWNLKKIKPGDKIIIKRADNSEVVFKVDLAAKFSQNNFPTRAVYGATTSPTLRLITCNGVWDKKAGRYSENLVVFASLAPP